MPPKGNASLDLWSEHRFVSHDETPIFFRALTPSSATKTAMIVVHGMGEHGGRYTAFAEHLASAGIASYLPDLRGFGQSGGKRGCLRKFSDYFSDLAVVYRLAKEKAGVSGLFFMGHSYGGLVVSSFLAERPEIEARGLVLSSPNFGISLKIPRWRHFLACAGSCLFSDLTQNNRVDPAFLTHDAEIKKKYGSDRLIHHQISARLYSELVRMIRCADTTASRIHIPALVLQAGDDRVVSREATVRFFEKLRSQNKELEIYEGLYHELLNETTREAIFLKISQWVLSRSIFN